MRVASIDVGTNAIRFLAAEFEDDASYRVIEETRLPLRMGHGVFNGDGIEPEMAAAAAEGLAQFSLRMKELSIARYRAVATSAVRESANRRAFLRRVRARAGLRLEVISGSEEIRLVHAAVRRRLSMGPQPWVLVELGGGSVEIALANDTRVIWCETHAMGAVRLLELFSKSAEEPRGFSRLVEEYVATIRLPTRLMEGKATGFIATGGNIEALVRVKSGGEPGDGLARLTRQDLHELTRTLSRMSVEERMRQYQLRPDRADVIVPAAIVYEHLADLVGADSIYVPGGGIREGIVFELMERLTARQDVRERNAVDDAATLGRKYNLDEVHARHVAHLASLLFDQLRDLHGLGVRDRRLLAAAAVLHDVGDYVSFKGHHKHSQYLISRSELPGFTPTEMYLIGNIARYHRKGPPSILHQDFAMLSPVDRDKVRMLAALLRVADALDKEHRQKIRDLQVSVKEREVRIRAAGADEVLLEQWALRKKDDLFRDVFGKDVTLATAGEDAGG